MDTITRISDLPDSNNVMANTMNPGAMNGYSPMIPSGQGPVGGPGQGPGQVAGPGGYVPINVHPNPYGISAQNPIMPQPEQAQGPSRASEQRGPYFSEEQLMQMQRQRLPSRDIPQDTADHMQDEQVRANYVPKVRFAEDYVRKQEDMTERNLREYEEKNKRAHKLDILLNELQTPIFIAILYLFFQLPIVNAFFKRFSFLAIYLPDGHFNFNGLLLKSAMFGGAYYLLMKSIAFIE